MYTSNLATRAGLVVAVVAVLSGILAAGVARDLAIDPAGVPKAAVAGDLPLLPEVVVTATRLAA
jgi:hypothetical protein